MIGNVNCGLSQQLTGLLVNPLTRKLPLMSTDVNCGLSLQLTCQLVNLSTCLLIHSSTTNKALRITRMTRILANFEL